MARLTVVFIGIAVVFSMIAFNGGNPLVGALFAVVAAAPVRYLGYLVVTGRRSGGALVEAPRPERRRRQTLFLREARAGRKVGSEQLLGSGKPDCLGLVCLKRGTGELHTEPEFADYQAVLRKYVDR
ncbi:hypothetical protein [Streptomyces sp. cg2]|uniref:hypothetical protein n=1 Tax=Streptomyces sp. cg2 TaxID=3238799 RepID=UPI0034E23689